MVNFFLRALFGDPEPFLKLLLIFNDLTYASICFLKSLILSRFLGFLSFFIITLILTLMGVGLAALGYLVALLTNFFAIASFFCSFLFRALEASAILCLI